MAQTSFLWSKIDEGQNHNHWYTLNTVTYINTLLGFSLGPKAIILASQSVSSVDYTTLCYYYPEENNRQGTEDFSQPLCSQSILPDSDHSTACWICGHSGCLCRWPWMHFSRRHILNSKSSHVSTCWSLHVQLGLQGKAELKAIPCPCRRPEFLTA